MSFRICHFLCVHTREDTFTIVHMLGGVHVYLHTWRIYGTLLHCHADITRHMANTQGTHAGQMSGQSHFLICECSYNSYHRYRQTLSLTHTHRCVWEYWCMRILMYVLHIHWCTRILMYVHQYSHLISMLECISILVHQCMCSTYISASVFSCMSILVHEYSHTNLSHQYAGEYWCTYTPNSLKYTHIHTTGGKHECTYTKLSLTHTHTHLTGDTDVLVLVNPLGVHRSLRDQHLHHARNLLSCT